MSLEMLTILFAIIGVGVALGGLIQMRLKSIDERLSRLEEAVADLREQMVELCERMTKLEGFIKT